MALRVCAVVVTFNRRELLAQCLRALLGQTRPPETVLVVNNASTDGTGEMLGRDFPQVQVAEMPRNIGASGGFHAAMRSAYEKGYDWIWAMDDDSLPAATALEKLLAEAERHTPAAEPALALWSTVATNDPPAGIPPEAPTGDNGVNEEVPHAMFVGFALPRSTINRVGLPRGDFFIYNDDVEYCLRIRRAGGKILRVGESFVYHKDWQTHVRRRKFLGREITYPDIPAWRVYYLLRNHMLTYKHLGTWRTARCLARCGVFLLKSLLVGARHERHIAVAALHGLLDVAGPRVRVTSNRKRES